MQRMTDDKAEASRIMLGLLDAVGKDSEQSQRHLASELGIALGLVNAYLKRCMKKGLVKVRQAPARRYAYYLTPQGFAEKSRLTVEYLSYSFSFFRHAKADCSELFRVASERGLDRVLFFGQSDLAEIAGLCAMEQGVAIVGLVDAETDLEQFFGAPVFRNLDAVNLPFGAVLITDVKNASSNCELAITRLGTERVLVPNLLGLHIQQQAGAEL